MLQVLSERMTVTQVKALAASVLSAGEPACRRLFELTAATLRGNGATLLPAAAPLSAEAADRTAVNALWVLMHLARQKQLPALFRSHREALIDAAIVEPHPSKRRLLLAVIEMQPFEASEVRADLLNHCFETIGRPDELCATRALCVKLAFKLCRCYPDLLKELAGLLGLIGETPLPPALAAVRRTALKRIACALKQGRRPSAC